MSLPFDATLKDLGGTFPRDFLSAFDQPTTQPVCPLNIDLSTVTTAADLVLGLGDPLTEIIHIDFQGSASATKHAEILTYNALLFAHYLVPVHSIVLLLRPAAAHANLNGTVNYTARPGRGKMSFGYEVIPLWEQPAERLLAGGLGTLPLAVLGQVPAGTEIEEGLTGVAQRIIDRLQAEAPQDQCRHLLTAAFVLTGLRLPRDSARNVFKGVRAMRESDTFMAILDEGQEVHAKSLLFRFGEEKFGAADDSVKTRLEGITDLERLDRMIMRLFRATATSWQDLLDTT